MTNIILINGPCGIWKSTLATLLHSRITWSFLRQKDEQRRMISWYKDSKENYKRSAATTFQLTNAIITWCIDSNTPLIYEGFMRNLEQINEFQQHTIHQWWTFYHFILNTPKDIWKERIQNRWVSGSLTFEKAEQFYDDIQKLMKVSQYIEVDVSWEDKNKIIDEIDLYLK